MNETKVPGAATRSAHGRGRRTVVLVAAFSVLAGTVLWRAQHAYDAPSHWVVEPCDADLTRANALEFVSPVIGPGEAGEWDESIREIGNCIYNPDSGEWLFYYSGMARDGKDNEVYVGLAVSKDGTTFTKVGRALEPPAEDPYVVFADGAFHLFYEDKSETPFRKVDLACSRDGRNWEVVSRGVITPQAQSWQDADVSSPVVVRTGAGWTMLYEGRGTESQGRIGIAVADDLLGPWRQSREFVVGGEGSWDHEAVPDDVIRQDGRYVLIYHGRPERNALAERVWGREAIWHTGLMVSPDLRSWARVSSGPISAASTLMIMQRDEKISLFGEPESSGAARTFRGVRMYRPVAASRTRASPRRQR